MGAAALTLTAEAASGNDSILSVVNAIGGKWEYATAAQNETLTTLYELASNLLSASTASAVATSASATTKSYIGTQLEAATVAYVSYAGVSPTNATAITQSLTQALYVSIIYNHVFSQTLTILLYTIGRFC